MGWLYVFIRTYPFWAIPLGIALFTTSAKAKKSEKGKKRIHFAMAVLLIASSVYFLYMRGHTDAVPFFHSVFYGK